MMTYTEETQKVLVLMVKYLSALHDWSTARESVLTPDEWRVILAAIRPMQALGNLLESGEVMPRGLHSLQVTRDTLYELMTNDTPQRYSSDILGQY
jgi:hypothetical protein